MAEFITKDFLLQNETARVLYHEYAAKMPIFDYHCHIDPAQIAEDKQFTNLTQVWLSGDHYKWRAMRANGVDEKYITGDGSDFEKFRIWCGTVPYTLRNPLYHWSHLELKRYFGVGELLNFETADGIYKRCNEMLNTPEFSTRNLIRKMNVKVICTTDDPIDSLEYHKRIADDGFEVKVLPSWRPDKGMNTEDVTALNEWIDALGLAADVYISSYTDYLDAMRKRHKYFHKNGCRISDHGLERAYGEDHNDSEIHKIFDKIRCGHEPGLSDQLKFKSAMMYEFAVMDAEAGWTQQLHLGALRNNNKRMLKTLGPDTGFDSIGDVQIAKPLAKFLDRLEADGKLPKTILYNLNPCDNEVIASMIGNFQGSSVPGKMQFGSAWWFLDQKDGMEKQINCLSNFGLLGRFVGMVTDSRSFLSYPRHEYFRRILCNILGGDMENGLVPDDVKLIGKMIEDICFQNAASYFISD